MLGCSVAENRVHVHDLHATTNQMGLDHEQLTYRYSGRDYRSSMSTARSSRTSSPADVTACGRALLKRQPLILFAAQLATQARRFSARRSADIGRVRQCHGPDEKPYVDLRLDVCRRRRVCPLGQAHRPPRSRRTDAAVLGQQPLSAAQKKALRNGCRPVPGTLSTGRSSRQRPLPLRG